MQAKWFASREGLLVLGIDHVHVGKHSASYQITGASKERVQTAQNQLVVDIFAAFVASNDPCNPQYRQMIGYGGHIIPHQFL